MKIVKLLLVGLLVSVANVSAHASDVPVPNGLSANPINYRFVGHLGEFDDAGRLLVWEGTIDGPISGDVKWWFVVPSPIPPGVHVGGATAFYQAYWEISQEGRMVLAGESAGKTVFADGEDGIWDGHGVVTDAKGRFSPLKGRKIYESGPVLVGDNPPVTYEGAGIFSIY